MAATDVMELLEQRRVNVHCHYVMAKLFVNLTLTINLSKEILWCNNSNETSFIWQRFYKILFISLDFAKIHLNFFVFFPWPLLRYY